MMTTRQRIWQKTPMRNIEGLVRRGMAITPRLTLGDRSRASAKRRSTVARYGVACIAVGAALLVRLAISPLVFGDTPFLLFFGAVLVAAWYGGLGPGIVATVLADLCADYFFLAPVYEFWSGTWQQNFPQVLFLAEAGLICWLTNRLTATNEFLSLRTAQLKRMASDLTRVEQRERDRLAQFLHDELQQLLVGAKYRVSAITTDQHGRATQAAAAQVNEVLDQAIKASRILTSELSLTVAGETCFGESLTRLAQQMKSLHGLDVHVAGEADIQIEPEETRVLLLRCVRELFLNIVKHAKVAEAGVRIDQIDRDHVQVAVIDNGVGCDSGAALHPGAVDATFGLFSIRERLALLGGQMLLTSTPGGGCRVTLTVPVRAPGQAMAIARAQEEARQNRERVTPSQESLRDVHPPRMAESNSWHEPPLVR
jgi:signal transduction histidine kinase